MTSIEIPAGVTSIGHYAFCGCSGLTSIKLPAGLTSIGGSAFSGCSGLTRIKLPTGLTSVGNSAFGGCSGLTSIKFPAGLTSVGNSAFSGCSGLTSIEIPAGLTSIEHYAFWGCSGLKDIYCAVEAPVELNSDKNYWSEETFADCVLHVRPGTAAAYREADVWKKFQRIEDDFTTGVDEVSADGDACIRLTDGGLVLGGGAWMVCTPGGQCVARGTGSETLHLPAGIYVVRCGKAARTVVVK